MKTKKILIVLLLLILPVLANGEPSNQKPIVILYGDGEKTIDLNDLSTATIKTNHIIYHMLYKVLPQTYNIPIKLKPVSWSRGLDLIKLGFADGIINASYNEERAEYAVYPMKDGKHNPEKRLRGTSYSLYKNSNSSIEWDGKEITKIDGDIGSVKSYSIVKDLQEMGVEVKEFQFELKIMKDVAIGKLKAIAIQDYVANSFIQKDPFLKKNIIKLQPPLKNKDYYLIFSKKYYSEHRKLAETIWDVMEEYSHSEEYSRLRQEFEK